MLRAGRALLVATTILTSPALAQGPGSNFGGLIGGASLMTSDGGGLYWIVAGVVFATVGAVANAWVLLVEINR